MVFDRETFLKQYTRLFLKQLADTQGTLRDIGEILEDTSFDEDVNDFGDPGEYENRTLQGIMEALEPYLPKE